MMQADDIRTLFFTIGIITLIILLFFAFVRMMNYGELENDEKNVFNKFMKGLSISTLLGFSAYIFMPSTNTIAAMVVLPKITSPEAVNTIKTSAHEIYDAALQALKTLSEPTKEKKE
jgi:hypothetical protein